MSAFQPPDRRRRYTNQLLAGELAHAGFWAGWVPNYDDMTYTSAPTLSSVGGGQVPSMLPNPCLAAADWTPEHKFNLMGIHVQGTDMPPAKTIPFCTTATSVWAATGMSTRANSDVLVVRHVEPCVAGSATSPECTDTTASGEDVYFQMSSCSGEHRKPFVLGTAGIWPAHARLGTRPPRRIG